MKVTEPTHFTLSSSGDRTSMINASIIVLVTLE